MNTTTRDRWYFVYSLPFPLESRFVSRRDRGYSSVVGLDIQMRVGTLESKYRVALVCWMTDILTMDDNN